MSDEARGGLVIVRMPELDAILEPHQTGQLTVSLEHGEWSYHAGVRSTLTDDQVDDFAEWALEQFGRVVETGDPDRLGWGRSKYLEDRWYTTLATYVLPDMSFLDDVVTDWPDNNDIDGMK